MITAFFPESARGHAIGTWSGFSAITTAIGPVMGGWLIEHATWHWVFFLNIPLALSVLLLVRGIPESRNEAASPHVDWIGASLVTLGLGGVTYALIEWPGRIQRGPHVLVLAAVTGLCALGVFIAVERRSRTPMVSLDLFRSRNFTGANVLTLFLYASLGALMFLFPMDLIQIQHYTATQAGGAFLPFITIMFVLSRWAGGLVVRYGSRLPLTIGPLIAGCGMSLLAIASNSGRYLTGFFPAVVVMGVGMAISVAPLTTTVMNAVPSSESGLASGINNAVSRVASLLAVAVFGALLSMVFNNSLNKHLTQLAICPECRAQIDATRSQMVAIRSDDPEIQRAIVESFLSGYRVVIWIASALAALGGATAWLLIEPLPRSCSLED